MATRKIAPALAAGCTVVLKPAAETPLTAMAIVRLLHAAGAPAGVVNLAPTTDAAAMVTTWLEDPRVRKISFTGSTQIGRLLLAQATMRVVNSAMELGGNAPFVVTADADLEAAVEGAMTAKFRDGGQACTAANRLFVHADVIDEFTVKFGAAVTALRVGPASDPASQVARSSRRKPCSGSFSGSRRGGVRRAHHPPSPPPRWGHRTLRRPDRSPRRRSSLRRSSVPSRRS